MRRDAKGKFQAKGFLFPIPSAALLANIAFFLFILIPWLFVGVKFRIGEKIYESLSFLFETRCNCLQCENGAPPKY